MSSAAATTYVCTSASDLQTQLIILIVSLSLNVIQTFATTLKLRFNSDHCRFSLRPPGRSPFSEREAKIKNDGTNALKEVVVVED